MSTPGFKVVPGHHGHSVVRVSDGLTMAWCGEASSSAGRITGSDTLRLATLFAAAPAMLDALESLLNVTDGDDLPAWDEAEAAVARARS